MISLNNLEFLNAMITDKFPDQHILKPFQVVLLESIKVADILFEEDVSKRNNWFITKNSYFFDWSPLETILMGKGESVLAFLKERTGTC